MKPFILGIIPARGGSKGIKDKNLRLLAGKPLIQYTIEAALNSKALSDIIVTTDSPIIAELSKKLGAKVPFLRPDHLATDAASTVDVVIHAIKTYEELQNMMIDIVVLLQPTAPMRTANDIADSLDLFMRSGESESLISCYEANHIHPNIMYTMSGEKMSPHVNAEESIKRRQDFEPIYVRNGAIYIARRNMVFESHSLVGDGPLGYIMPRNRSINIDEPFDIELAEFFIFKRSAETNK